MEKPFEVYQIVKELEKSKEKVNESLKTLLGKTLSEKEIEFNSSFETLQEILKEIGRGLYRAAKNVTGKDDLIFYFWPGYTTIRDKRVLIEGKIHNFNEADKKYYTGIGFKNSINAESNIEIDEFFDCPSTLYYDAVLSSYKDYIPPTTHNWKRQQPDFQIKLKEDDSNLKILLIEKGNNTEVISKNKTLLHITFDAEEVGNSVEEIAKLMDFEADNIIVNPEEKIKDFKKWPFNVDKSKIIKNENLEAAQKLIYPVWFAATFCDSLSNYDQKYGENNWLNRIKERLCEFGLSDLCQRIKDYQTAEANHFMVRNENYHNVNFRYWYSLFFDNYDSNNELGSAMFLTNEELPKEFLYYISPWLKFMYGQIRALDSATLVEVKTKKAEWETIVDEMSHSMAFPFGELTNRLDQIRINVSNSNYDKFEINRERASAVVKQLSDINLYLFYLVKAEQEGNLEKEVEEFFKLEENDLYDILINCFNNIELSLELLRISDKHKRNIQNRLVDIINSFKELNQIKIVSNKIGIEIVLLDLLKNALRYTLPDDPIIEIKFIENYDDNYSAISIMNNYFMDIEAYNFILSNNETNQWSKSRKVGIRTVKRILNNSLFVKHPKKCRLEIDKCSLNKELGETIFYLLIPKEAIKL